MDVLYPRCGGLDVHQQTVVACVRVASGSTVQQEVRTFGTTTADLLTLVDWLTVHGCTHVAMESTGVYWKPIMIEAIIRGEQDPERLADLSQGRLKASRPAVIAAVQGRVTPHHRFLLRLHLAQIDALEVAVREVEARLGEALTPVQAALDRLMTIPAVGRTVARVIVAEIGLEMNRFPTPGHVVSWAGLCPRLHESAGKRLSTRTRPGNPWLKTTLVQVAWVAARTRNTYLRAQFLRLKSRRGPKTAILGVAASMLTAASHILRDEATYHELGPDYFERRSKAHLTRRLIRRLEELGLSVEVRPAA
jgi:transposase